MSKCRCASSCSAGTAWKIVSSTQPYEKEDAATILFPVKVAKNGSDEVRYRVRYTW